MDLHGFFFNLPKTTIFSLFVIGVELMFYGIFLLLIVVFGYWYAKRSSHTLLVKFGDVSRLFFEIIFLCLCFQLYYASVYSELLPASGLYLFSGTYYVTYYTQVVKLISLALWLGLSRYLDTLVLGAAKMSKHHGIAEFPLLSFLVISLSFAMISSNNLAFLFIGLEGFSLILYILATVGRSTGGITAAVKYFIFGTAGSILILWSLIHFYEFTSSVSLSTLFYLLQLSEEFFMVYPSLTIRSEWISVILLVGFLVKLGAAPFHQWVSDVYSGVPLFITSFYSLYVKFILYVLFIRLSYFLTFGQELEYAALLSLCVGVVGTLRQVEIKRFLAYGSITHVGFLLSGDLLSSFTYLASYLAASFLFFTILLQLRLNNKEIIYLSDLRFLNRSSGQSYRTFLVVSLASMAGLPPFAGFYGKMMIWTSLIEDIYLFNDWTSILLLLSNLFFSLIIIFYYMKLIIFSFVSNELIQPWKVRSYLNEFWKISRALGGKWPWNLFRRDVLLAFRLAALVPSRDSSRLVKFVRRAFYFPPYSPFGLVAYIKMRTVDFNSLNYVLVGFISFWTFFMPSMLTIFIFVLETII